MNSAFSAPLRARSFPLAALTVAVAASLAACGGGGGGSDGNATTATPRTSTVSPNNNSSTPAAPSPGPSQPPDPKYAAAPGSEPLPSLKAPQGGSTAAVSTGHDGIYYTKNEKPAQIAFLEPDYRLTSRKGESWFWGGLDVRRTAWTFKSESVGTDDGESLKDLTGSGTFISKDSMFGTYKFDSAATNIWGSLSYAYENALAVDQASMVGSWGALDVDGMALTVDAMGAIKGTTAGANYGVCNVTGSVIQREPGTKKNMYTMELTPVNAATGSQPACQLKAPFRGTAIIGLLAAGTYDSNGYYRALVGLLNTTGHARFSMALKHQG